MWPALRRGDEIPVEQLPDVALSAPGRYAQVLSERGGCDVPIPGKQYGCRLERPVEALGCGSGGDGNGCAEYVAVLERGGFAAVCPRVLLEVPHPAAQLLGVSELREHPCDVRVL